MDTTHSKTVLFVTGAFVSNSCWDTWIDYFESKGYNAYAPPWPNKDASATELRRRHPDSELGLLTLDEVVKSYADFARSLPEKPIIIGHSMGGLITQLLIQKNLGVVGVAYHSVPPQGVLSFEFSFLKSLIPPLGLFKSKKKPYLMSFKHWQYTFTNGMPLEEQKAAYEAVTIPESRKAIWGALSKAAKIKFKNPHVPLLFVSGSTDHIMPASLNKKNAKSYKDPNSIVEYKEFEGRNHFAAGLDTWQEEADFILNWLNKIGVNSLFVSTEY